MDRLVHHELRAVFSVLAATAVALTASVLFHGFSPPSDTGRLALYAAGVLALLLVWTLLRASRLRWFSEVRNFEKAVPVEDIDPPGAAERLLRHRPFSPRLFVGYVLGAVPLALWQPLTTGIFLWSALDWLSEAAVAAHWERRNGLLLWRGRVDSRPWELSVSRRPPTRTATGAQPA
ncbi:hypothetical protein [Streptomyces lomondensis]|uniref:Uncharacterized protein n=1 Tax=Streptomyces lomondensis TaxID=68229 RepID=A0ABQ2X144_9ACTN|nr:hypothetical protein [Streptomyces lomondensis]MCF0075826.1 hypothetical protein [Streptomyces lomondensis]GGW90693.1 hypothetical protein GCM10010383_20390 [Streptomyces lomondensis]